MILINFLIVLVQIGLFGAFDSLEVGLNESIEQDDVDDHHDGEADGADCEEADVYVLLVDHDPSDHPAKRENAEHDEREDVGERGDAKGRSGLVGLVKHEHEAEVKKNGVELDGESCYGVADEQVKYESNREGAKYLENLI